ncbi:DinB family protein [Nocardioides euryhalodurans]|uniref:DinB family protein n=1 Tax=Nocardioides euryhalodurans TaxID=2518370 RepID=A0A4P7GGP1_9ACTN|nr:DinB family protein [Nocardioides euryhalodurans]QBR91030.1 DinB family protein [Nocardioides euryhalodurans]
MPARRERPAFDADDRTSLLGWYDLQRGIVTLKCEGLSDEDAHRSVIPTSPLMTVAGIVGHLTWAEQLWFEHAFLGREPEGPGWDDVEDSEFLVQDRSLDELLAAYDEQCRRSDDVIASHSLSDTGVGTAFPAAGATLGWMLVHMLEETARHAGHLDLVRELLDGETGYY